MRVRGGGGLYLDPTFVPESNTDKIPEVVILTVWGPQKVGVEVGVLLIQLLFLSPKLTKSQSLILTVEEGGLGGV